MKQKINQFKRLAVAGFLAVSIFALSAAPASAQSSFLQGGIIKCGKKAPAGSPQLQGTGVYKDCTISDFFGGVYLIVNFLISVAGLIAVFFIFWGAIQLLFSRGNPTQVGAAKSTIWNAVLGLVLILLSYVIISYVAGLLLPGAGSNPLQIFKSYTPGQN